MSLELLRKKSERPSPKSPKSRIGRTTAFAGMSGHVTKKLGLKVESKGVRPSRVAGHVLSKSKRRGKSCLRDYSHLCVSYVSSIRARRLKVRVLHISVSILRPRVAQHILLSTLRSF